MYSNTENYTEQGGGVTHFDGKVVFEEGCVIEGLRAAANQASSTAAEVSALKDDFNALLEKRKVAGLMAADSE